MYVRVRHNGCQNRPIYEYRVNPASPLYIYIYIFIYKYIYMYIYI
jgi:hypothetical protein